MAQAEGLLAQHGAASAATRTLAPTVHHPQCSSTLSAQ